MRKVISYAIVVAMALLTFGSCSRNKTIPDDTLSDIFRDMFLVNAYTGRTSIDYDSINIYEPILNSYGYTTKEFINTLGDFTKRKSSRLSDVVEEAIAKLDDMNAELTLKVQTLDRVDSIAYELTKSVAYADSLIQIRSLADSAAMKITIPAQKGKYNITYYYYQDSTDLNRNLTNRYTVYDSLGKSLISNSSRMKLGQRTLLTTTFDAPENADSLVMTLGNYPRDPKIMYLDIDSLVVAYYPPREEALEALLRSYIDYELIVNGLPYYEYYDLPADSSTLLIQPPLTPEKPDTLAVE